MSIIAVLRIVPIAICLFAINVQAETSTPSNIKSTTAMSDLPRDEKLPLFDPHRKSFTCTYQAQHVPPIDPQAELWFQQALALDDPDLYYQKRDYAKIYQLYVQAAERGHWKAMLNVASLIRSNYPGVPQHDPEIAIEWIEKAMKLGVPDAYDMMGVYHQNGLVKGGDATTAYAFFQRAADMGSPSAMAFLGEKLDATYDDSDGEFWGNLPIATQMLECAVAQGYGDAAEELSFVYARPRTTDAKRRALTMLQEGVKLGSAKCATKLSIEFDGFNLTNGRNLPGSIDKARADRYRALKAALERYQGRMRLPNLDKVLPLPPAALPKWDGNPKTLLDAAKAVTPSPKSQKAAALGGRAFVPDGYAVARLEDGNGLTVTGDQRVPKTGYWLALYGSSAESDAWLAARAGHPERFEAGEQFELATHDWLSSDRVHWHYLGEAFQLPPQRADFIAHLVGAGMMREIPGQPSRVRCAGERSCPETGIWEGRIAEAHPMANLYNRWDQQA
uniref:SEL1-like repeat protein n=1 Tax=Burkholderia diffusa TaxID=488732 RepID=UPI001CC37540